MVGAMQPGQDIVPIGFPLSMEPTDRPAGLGAGGNAHHG
jgi:hypothetical protein